ncbi:MAG: hypothetical protein K9M84_00475 [Spirochaetia bacterium]|nr:hypothetical protein [Spirochaetia bacterium]MCF7940062.1 hypothetical protein [Spirochaetia bacterium]
MTKKISLVFLLLIISISVFADDNTNNQNVTVNINVSDLKEELGLNTGITNMRNDPNVGFGISTPIIGTNHDIFHGTEKFTTKTTGINVCLGYTWRTYMGEGLPTHGGAFYYEFFTMALFVPMVGAGYDYRIGENFTLGIGFPDMIHGSISF